MHLLILHFKMIQIKPIALLKVTLVYWITLFVRNTPHGVNILENVPDCLVILDLPWVTVYKDKK